MGKPRARHCGGRAAAIWVAAWLAAWWVPADVGRGQFGGEPLLTTDLSGEIRVDEADGETRAHLERVEAFLAERQWDEAVETLRRVMEDRGDQLVPRAVPDGSASDGPVQYVTVREYGQRRLAAWAREAPEALDLYRRRVDPLAQRWWQQGVAERDAAALSRVADQLFASSYGDNALFALGEIYLERGWHARARACWEQISPLLRAPAVPRPPLGGSPGGPLWLALRGLSADADWPAIGEALTSEETPPDWLAYPDTDLNLADVRARLVLVSILEGSLQRARIELDLLRRLAPDATGMMGGRKVVYVELLGALLDEAAQWPPARESWTWPAFAGAPSRNKVLPQGVDIAGSPIWRLQLGSPPRVERSLPEYLDFGSKRLAEDAGRLLSYHPLIVDSLVLVNDETQIRAVRVASGQPWPEGTDGVIYRAARDPFSAARRSPRRVGVPRFTMTVHEQKLFARMGSPVTSYPTDVDIPPADVGYLVGLDLARQGRLLPGFPIQPEDARWAFEGAPLADAAHLYVAMRRSDVRPQAHVACYRLATGQLKWRKLVCAAETPGHGMMEEITHNLLTMHEGTIFYNTNLGAVAALRAENGRVQWITAYPRSDRITPERGAGQFYRDLNPCLAYRSWVFAAPSDTEHIFAFDAATGQIVWQTDPDEGTHGSHSVHLLGVAGESLIVSGDRLWWIDVHSGKVLAQFPDGGSSVPTEGAVEPRGCGRGILAGEHVYWPTREKVFVFSQRVSTPGQPEMARQPIELNLDLATRQLPGGSLLMDKGIMLVVAAEELIALSETGEPPIEESPPPGEE